MSNYDLKKAVSTVKRALSLCYVDDRSTSKRKTVEAMKNNRPRSITEEQRR